MSANGALQRCGVSRRSDFARQSLLTHVLLRNYQNRPYYQTRVNLSHLKATVISGLTVGRLVIERRPYYPSYLLQSVRLQKDIQTTASMPFSVHLSPHRSSAKLRQRTAAANRLLVHQRKDYKKYVLSICVKLVIVPAVPVAHSKHAIAALLLTNAKRRNVPKTGLQAHFCMRNPLKHTKHGGAGPHLKGSSDSRLIS